MMDQINVLCIDGGRVEGITNLFIIEELMEQFPSQNEGETPVKPCQVFDLICGSETVGYGFTVSLSRSLTRKQTNSCSPWVP